jgi:hypothetical protein
MTPTFSLGRKIANLTVELPELCIVAVRQLLGVLSRFGFIRAQEVIAVHHMTIRADNEGSIFAICHGSPGRLQSGRSQPLADMRSGLRLPSLPEHRVAGCARCKQSGFLAQSFRLFGETFFKVFDLFETASLLLLHGAAPLQVLGGSATDVLITDKCQGSGGDAISRFS